jgi:hypothetical protein
MLTIAGGIIIFVIGFVIFTVTMCCTFEWYSALVDWFLQRFENVFQFFGRHVWKFVGFGISGAMMYGALKLVHVV